MIVAIAIDKHKIPRYDKKIGPHLIRSRPEKGTKTFETYITVQSVEEMQRAQIGCISVNSFDENADLVRRLLENCTKNRIRISTVLLDREFFSVDVITQLKKLHHRFLMPCVKTFGIKQAILEHSEKVRDCISDYTLTSGDKRSDTFTLVIVPGKDADNEADPLKRYICFATNISRGKIFANISQIPQEYRKRWGIETGYAGIEKFRARTTSKNQSIRLLYFYYSLILFNAWIVANCLAARRYGNNVKPVIPIEMLKGVFHMMILQDIRMNHCDYFMECVK